MRQDKRDRVEMDAGNGHDEPAEARNEDVQMEEERGDGRTVQNADNSSNRTSDEASDAAENWSSQHGGSSSSTSQARSSNDTRNADAKP